MGTKMTFLYFSKRPFSKTNSSFLDFTYYEVKCPNNGYLYCVSHLEFSDVDFFFKKMFIKVNRDTYISFHIGKKKQFYSAA